MNLLIISPSSSALYQDLKKNFSAKETNIWAGLLANVARKAGHGVTIYDCEIETPDKKELADAVKSINPDLILFVVTGQNPNASSAAMAGATEEAEVIRSYHPEYKIAFVGPHVNSLPFETLMKHRYIDICFTNEGVYALLSLLATDLSDEALKKIKGIAWRDSQGGTITINDPERIVPQDRLEEDLPGVAYDLMPDLSKYRTSLWHTQFQGDTSPFASIYTSLGCYQTCSFCLHPTTNITLSKNRNKNIKDVVVGDKLLGWDESVNDYAETTVVKTSCRKTEQIYKVTFNTNRRTKFVKCTGEHPFYTGGKWIEAKNLRIGDKLLMMGRYDKNTFRMKHYNPVHTHNCAQQGADTRKKNGYIPYMCTDEGVEKIREAARKRASSSDNPMFKKENREKASKRMRGKNNPCWAGGVSTMYKEYPVEFSNSLKKKIRRRDSLTCMECSKKHCQLDVHHIDYDKHNNNECNLITLCRSCHMKTNHNRDTYTKRYQELQRSRGLCPVEVTISNIEILEIETDVYNVECSPHNNYFANNILVHNCMINSINRTSNDFNLAADSFNVFRYWNPEFTIKQLEYLADKGIKHLKIADEMFVYRPKHFMRLCELIIDRGLDFNIWAYSRVDTAKPHYLETLRKAGVKHLALGIESGNQVVRQTIDKGRFKEVNIRDVVNEIVRHDIGVGGNFILGLPTDNYDTMQQTMNLAFELDLANMNVYCATALPGSPLYIQAKQEGRKLPTEYSEFGFLSYDHVPDSTDFLTSEQVLEFRDYFFDSYFTNPGVLDRIKRRYGQAAVDNVYKMTQVKLKRKLLGG